MTEPVGPVPQLGRLVTIPNHSGPPDRPPADIEGVTLSGEHRKVRVVGASCRTLLLFLSGGCDGCAELWPVLGGVTGTPLEACADSVVGIVRRTGKEDPGVVAPLVPAGALVLVSEQAFVDYGVLGAPFFVLVDGGGTGRVLTEGVPFGLSSVWESVARSTSPGGSTAATAAANDLG